MKKLLLLFLLLSLGTSLSAQVYNYPSLTPGIVYGGGGLSTTASYGGNIAPAITAANWTCGAGWDCSVAGTLNKNADGVGTAAPTVALTPVAGTVYRVTIVTNVTVASGATFTLGASAARTLSTSGTNTYFITAITNASLVITPTPTATRFTITSILVEPMTDATGDVTIDGNLTVRSPSYFYGSVLIPDGTVAAPGMAFASNPTTGIYYSGGIRFAYAGTESAFIGNTGIGHSLRLGGDTYLTRTAANTIGMYSGVNPQAFRVYAGYDTYVGLASAQEEITLSTTGTTTDSTANLLPANAIILGVTTRVTTAITTCTTFDVGDATTAERFITDSTGVSLASVAVGMNAMKGGVASDAAGPTQSAAAKIRITCDLTAGAGKIRVGVFYMILSPPGS